MATTSSAPVRRRPSGEPPPFPRVELPRPTEPVLVDPDTYAFPSRPMSTLAITLYAAGFVLLPRGRGRNRLRAGILAVLVLVGLAELYLAADYLSGMLYAAILAPCVADVTFRWLVPEEGFPISYRRRGNAAHLDLDGERGKAIVRAMAGRPLVPVRAHHPVRAARGRDRHRLGAPPGRLRGLRAAPARRPRGAGRPHLRPGRAHPNQEYMLVTEFFEHARKLGDAEIDDVVIDEGLGMVRTFWDIGVAHRDIKPANLLVHDVHLQLVDVSALEVRPSPWRRAVDLSNMLLTLALRTDPERVYAGATKVFTPEEIAEACASAVGLTIPTELQAKM